MSNHPPTLSTAESQPPTELFDYGPIEDVTALWYIALCIVLTSLLFALGQRLARIELRVWRLESDLKKLSADRLIGDYCLENKIDKLRGDREID